MEGTANAPMTVVETVEFLRKVSKPEQNAMKRLVPAIVAGYPKKA